MGLDVYLYKCKNFNPDAEDQDEEKIEMPSKNYPDHIFQIGYFRSSYNESGINNLLKNLGLGTLYDLFDADDQYRFKPDWNAAKKKVSSAIAALKEKPNLRCFDVSWNEFMNPKDCKVTNEAEALEIYSVEASEEHSFDAYSNRNGIFYHKDPLEVLGLINGVKKTILSEISLPCVFVVTKGDNSWILEALSIVEETIDYVLSQEDKDDFILHWSS